MKVQGQKGKCKDGIKSYSLDRFEQVERSKIHLQTKIVFSHSYVNADHTVQLGFFLQIVQSFLLSMMLTFSQKSILDSPGLPSEYYCAMQCTETEKKISKF